MNYEKLVPLLAMVAITIIIAAPAMKRIVSNILEARRIRRHKKNLPGPLLGVVYPPHKTTDKETD
jgi:hypothetical protein